jgi:hypothetical protein
VQAERDGLVALRDEIQQELDGLGQAAGPSPSPSLSLEPQADPCVADGENAIDVLSCDWDATPEPEAPWEPSLPPTELEELPSAAPSPVLTPEPNLDQSPSPEPPSEALDGVGFVCPGELAAALEAPYTTLAAGEIKACFDECQDWIAWHAHFGDTLPEWCTTVAPELTEPPEAATEADLCWDDYGQWQLWGESQGQPLCAGVESE